MTQQLTKVDRIEGAIDRATAGGITVNSQQGGLALTSMTEIMEFSKLMAVSGCAVPQHLQGNPGACMAVCIQAVEWRMSPFAVANKSYSVNGRMAYESQLIHAVIEMRAPLVGRLRHKFIGDGGSRQCVVWGRVGGENEPFEITSPRFDQITTKNSPLWKSKPDVQLYYSTVRDWARVYFPDVILGVYSDDELKEAAPMETGGRAAVAMPRPLPPAVTSVATDVHDELKQQAEEEALRRIEERLAQARANGQQAHSDEGGQSETTGDEAETGGDAGGESGDSENEGDGDADRSQARSSPPSKISYEDIVALAQSKKPGGMDEGAATFRLGQVIRKAAGKVAPGVAVKQVWNGLAVEKQYEINDAIEGGAFPWVESAKK